MIWSAIPLLPCAYKQLFGVSCPMCGLQRSLVLLAQGLLMFPPLVALVVASVYFIVLFLRRRSLKGHRGMWIFLITVFIFNFFYQNLVEF